MVFCPKLLATREKYADLALESRCLTTIGRQNINKIPLFRMDKFLAESQLLRNKLLLWRFRNYYKIKEEAAQLEDKEIASKIYDGADNLSSRVKQVILPLWLIAGDSMKQTLTDMAKTFDNLLKIEDPDYLLELQARDAVKDLVNENQAETVNVRNVVNVLIDAASETFYEITLIQITRKILENQGISQTDQTSSEVQSVSKRLKNVFESTLGFLIRIGKKRSRVVLIPTKWVQEAEKLSGLELFLEGGDTYKNVHYDTNVHQEKPKETKIRENLSYAGSVSSVSSVSEKPKRAEFFVRPFEVNEIVRIQPLEHPLTGRCEYCDPKGSIDLVNYPKDLLTYNVETFDNKFLVCETCGQKLKKELGEVKNDE
jgi:hypothetical protein